MIVALDKYISFATFPSVETKGIADVKLPDLFVCLKRQDIFNKFDDNNENIIGYWNFLKGVTSRNPTPSFVSWEGNESMSYENMTRQLFTAIDDSDFMLDGNPKNNWNVELGKALNFLNLKDIIGKLPQLL